MGYYSTLYLDCNISDLEGLKGLLAEVKMKIASEIAEDWEQELDLIYLDEGGCLACEDYNAKWYSDEIWILKIAPFVSEGEIEFIGEDSERWGYLIEDGKSFYAVYEKTKGELLKE